MNPEVLSHSRPNMGTSHNARQSTHAGVGDGQADTADVLLTDLVLGDLQCPQTEPTSSDDQYVQHSCMHAHTQQRHHSVHTCSGVTIIFGQPPPGKHSLRAKIINRDRSGTVTHTHTHTSNGPLSGTTRVSRYQKGKNYLDSTEARDSEWQWHQLGRMQVCTSLQTDNHASTPPLS